LAVYTVSNSTATLVAAGTCTISALQAGNSTYAATTPVSHAFTVNAISTNPVPTMTGISPSFLLVGSAAQSITITGTKFLATTTATYNGLAHNPANISSTSLTLSLTASDPATAGIFNILLTNPTPGGGSASMIFYVLAPTVPGLSGPRIDVIRPTWTLAYAYYVDANRGNNNGTSSVTAWKTLAAVHNKVLGPGDVVYLARGSVWTLQQILLDNLSVGNAQKPVVFEAYGTGASPTISAPYALCSTPTDPIPFAAVVFGPNSHYITVLDLLIQNVDNGRGAVSMDENSDHLVFAGSETAVAGTGISIDGQHRTILSNYIHDIGSNGGTRGICAGIVGQDLEIGWNRFARCIVQTSDWPDGEAFEFFNYQPDVGFNYVSDNIRIHHNQIDSSYDFMKSYGTVTNMLIAYNVYTNSDIEALEFHFDHGWGHTESHLLSYNVRIENNTFMPTLTANPGGWGIIGLLLDNNAANNSDTTQRHISFKSKIFVTNYEITFTDGLANLVHDHNVFWFSENGKFDNQGNTDVTSTERIADPLFVSSDYTNLNLQLQLTSPAIDAGVNLGYMEDILQTLVPTTSAPDVGAYQHIATTPPANNPAPTITGVSPDFVVVGSAAQSITVLGTNFLPDTTATVDGAAHASLSQIPTSLQLILSQSDQAVVGNTKARNGQMITIAAFGGSIREGTAATTSAIDMPTGSKPGGIVNS
jgi:hypothetical protein